MNAAVWSTESAGLRLPFRQPIIGYALLRALIPVHHADGLSKVDTEKLLKLLNEPTEVNDLPNAPDLIVENGEIEFGRC